MVNNREHKIALYADDVLLYIRNSDVCHSALLDLLDIFTTYSSYKLNLQKTQILTFNYNRLSGLKQRISTDWSQRAIK